MAHIPPPADDTAARITTAAAKTLGLRPTRSEARGDTMRSLIIVLAALALASTASAAPNCTKGVPCGNACIAKGKVCHVGQGAGAAAAAAPAMAASATGAAANASATTGKPAGKAPPTCTPGKTKLCGKSCIPVSKTCHV